MSPVSKSRLNRTESVLICLFMIGLLFVYEQLWHKKKTFEIDTLTAHNLALKDVNEKTLASAKPSAALRMPAAAELPGDPANLERYLKANDRFSIAVMSMVANSRENSFLLTKIVSTEQTKINGYAQILYTLEAEASFISIGKFLEKLEQSALLTNVQSVDILRIENEMERCKVIIKLYSYVLGGDE